MSLRDQRDEVRSLQDKLFGMESMSHSLTEKTNKFEVINQQCMGLYNSLQSQQKQQAQLDKEINSLNLRVDLVASARIPELRSSITKNQ